MGTSKEALRELVQGLGLDPTLVSEDTRFEIWSGSQPAQFTLTVDVLVPNALSNKYLEAVGASFRLEEQ